MLDLKGRVRAGGTSLALHRSIHTLIQEDKLLILLNLHGVIHIDSCGLGELIASHISLRNRGGELKLLQVTETMREVMTAAKLLSVFEIYDKEDEALLSFSNTVVALRASQPFFV